MKEYRNWTGSEVKQLEKNENRAKQSADYWQQKYNEAMQEVCRLELELDELNVIKMQMDAGYIMHNREGYSPDFYEIQPKMECPPQDNGGKS